MEGPQILPLTTTLIQTLHLLLVFHSSFAQPVKKEVAFSSSACILKMYYCLCKFSYYVITVISTALIYIPLAILPNFLFTFFTTTEYLAKGFKGFYCNNFQSLFMLQIFKLIVCWFGSLFQGLSVCIHLHLLLARPGSLMIEIFSSSIAVSI